MISPVNILDQEQKRVISSIIEYVSDSSLGYVSPLNIVDKTLRDVLNAIIDFKNGVISEPSTINVTDIEVRRVLDSIIKHIKEN